MTHRTPLGGSKDWARVALRAHEESVLRQAEERGRQHALRQTRLRLGAREVLLVGMGLWLGFWIGRSFEAGASLAWWIQ